MSTSFNDVVFSAAASSECDSKIPTPFNDVVFCAAASGDLNRLREALISHPELIDTPHPTNHKLTPLHIAAIHGHDDSVRMLLNRGSRAPQAKDAFGFTPIEVAAANHQFSTMMLMNDHRNMFTSRL